jgi:hypothetical protein
MDLVARTSSDLAVLCIQQGMCTVHDVVPISDEYLHQNDAL